MFYQPHTIEEALALKRQHRSEAAFIAGGTDLIVLQNRGRVPAAIYIDLTHIEGVDTITLSDNRYTVGGATTCAQMAKLPVVSLSQAALSVGGPQIRNRATIAGNLASASPAGDLSVVLLSLDAQLELRSLERSRTVPVRGFFHDYRKTELAEDEIISKVSLPSDWQTAWYKLGKRGAMNISVVCCAVAMDPQGGFHVAYGSVGPFPLLVPKVGEFLAARVNRTDSGVTLTPEDAREVASIASEEVRPIDDFRAGGAYRRAMAGSLLVKCLRQMGIV